MNLNKKIPKLHPILIFFKNILWPPWSRHLATLYKVALCNSGQDHFAKKNANKQAQHWPLGGVGG
jgi:hypothetical protein